MCNYLRISSIKFESGTLADKYDCMQSVLTTTYLDEQYPDRPTRQQERDIKELVYFLPSF